MTSPVAALSELVRHEAWLTADRFSEVVIDTSRQLVESPRVLQAVLPDACEHRTLPVGSGSWRHLVFLLDTLSVAPGRRDSVTHSSPKSTVIAGNPRVSLRSGSRINRGNPPFSHCLPCRRSWVRVPSAASKRPANAGRFAALRSLDLLRSGTQRYPAPTSARAGEPRCRKPALKASVRPRRTLDLLRT